MLVVSKSSERWGDNPRSRQERLYKEGAGRRGGVKKVRSVFSPNQSERLCARMWARMCRGSLFTWCCISAMMRSVLGGWILVPEWICVVSVTWTGGVLDA